MRIKAKVKLINRRALFLAKRRNEKQRQKKKEKEFKRLEWLWLHL